MNPAPETKAAAAPPRTTANHPKRCEQSSNSNDRLQAAKMSVFRNATGTKPIGDMILEDLFREVRDGSQRAMIELIRTEQDEDKRGTLKKELKAVTLSGKVTSGGRAKAAEKGRFAHSGFLQIDIDEDELQACLPSDARDMLADDPHIIMAFISPSGNGVKAVMLVPPAATKEGHTATFLSAERYMADTYELKMDKATKDPVRMCFLSHDPDARWNSEAVPLVTVAPRTASQKTSKTSKSFKMGANTGIEEPPHHGIHDWLLRSIRHCEQHGLTKEYTAAKFKAYDGTLRRPFQPTEVDDACRDIYATPSKSIFDIPPATTEELNLAKYTMTDSGNAERVHAYAGSNFRYVSESGRWLLWDGKRWIPDTNGGMVRLFISVMKMLGKSAIECGDPDRAKSITKHALYSMDSSKVTAGLQMLKSIIGVSISVNDLDADQWMIGTAGGMIDLKTGKTITPDRSKLITKIIGTGYDASATCPTWEKFLKTVTNGDTELINFLQCAVGYTLTGSNREQCLFFLHGAGGNGKGVFSETIKKLMGDYGQTAPESLLMIDKNQSATNDIARLSGCRMAIRGELEEGTSFAESRIKSLTGDDTITARFLHKEFFDFIPTHHFWISGNHKPRITGSDDGIWRRIRLIPFIVRIPKEEKDLNFKDKLAKELPGILNWALEGCLRWQQEGLKTPSCVSKATEGYRAEEDIIGDFLAECTEEKFGEHVLVSSLYECYQNWAQKGGIKHPLTVRALNKKFDDRGMERHLSNGGRYWKGLVTI